MSAVGAYLAKKRWNPGNLKNVEGVWVQEQKEKEQKKREDERRREIEEERAEEELDKLQEEAGVKKVAGRLKWMYEGGLGTGRGDKEMDAKEREKFLLGQKTMPQFDQGQQGTFGTLEKTTTGVMAVTADAIVSTVKRKRFNKEGGEEEDVSRVSMTTHHVAPKSHDQFILSHEDPMASMPTATAAPKRSRHESESANDEQTRHSKKKHKHKHKKDKKKKKSHHSSSSSSSD